MAGGAYVLIATMFAISAGLVGRKKGSSFFVWFLIGGVTLAFGLIAAVLYRVEDAEPERACPRCGAVQKLYVQVCPRCGEDLYLPDPSEVRHPQTRSG